MFRRDFAIAARARAAAAALRKRKNGVTVSMSAVVVVTATAAAERREHALLCKEVVKVMPSWRRFSVDKHGTVHIREVSKPHWHGKAAPSQKGAISAAQAEKPTRRVSPSRAQRSALRAADRAQRERAAQVRLRTKGILEVLRRQWRGKRRDDVWTEWRRQKIAQSTLPPGVLAQSQPAAEAPATPAPAPPSTPAHPIGDHDMQDSRGAKRAEGETLHPKEQLLGHRWHVHTCCRGDNTPTVSLCARSVCSSFL